MTNFYRSESTQSIESDINVKTALLSGLPVEGEQDNATQPSTSGYGGNGRKDARSHPRGVRVLPMRHPDGESSSPGRERLPFWRKTPFISTHPTSWGQRLYNAMEATLPILGWVTSYDVRKCLRSDLLAGLTVGIMLVPQSISYAKLAKLPPIYGLYAGFVPVFAYAAFGSSRQLAVGPVALVSILVAVGLSPILDSELMHSPQWQDDYNRMALLLALLVGCMEALMGLVRLGWVVRFISHSVTSGFTSGAAVLIGLSQVKYFVGYKVDVKKADLISILKNIFANHNEFKWQPFLMGNLMLSVLLVMKEAGKSNKAYRHIRAAGPVTAVVTGTLFYHFMKPYLDLSSISIVGVIPSGLPPCTFHVYQWKHVVDLLPTASIITGVAVLESVGIAKALAARNGYELDSNKELLGLGISNILGSMFCAYPVTGSFSRSAVNNEAGAKTGLAGLVTGFMIWAVLLFLTPLFTEIPQNILAAIVISAVIGLIDYKEAIFLWSVEKRDFCLWFAAFLGTLFLGIEIGVLIAVGLSMIFVIYESANPHMAVLGRLPGTTVYRNVAQYPDAYKYHGIVVVRIDAPIYFANISYIKERLRKYELRTKGLPHRHGDVGDTSQVIRFVIIEMSPVTYIDSTAIHALKELYHEYQAREIQLALSNPNPNVMVTMAKAGIPEMIGREWYFVRVHDAVRVCLSYLQDEHGIMVAENQHVTVKREGGRRGVSAAIEVSPPTRIERSLSQRDPQTIFRVGSDINECEVHEALGGSPHLCPDTLA